jgi:hypothetical protein
MCMIRAAIDDGGNGTGSFAVETERRSSGYTLPTQTVDFVYILAVVIEMAVFGCTVSLAWVHEQNKIESSEPFRL